MDPLALILLGAALAGFAQGVSGFAFSLVALSIWAWVVPPEMAAPMSVFGALTGQLAALPWVWRGFSLRLLLPLVIGGLLGIPVGVTILHWLEPVTFRFCLGAFLVIYCPLVLVMGTAPRSRGPMPLADGFAGWLGGIGGGIAGIAGPFPTLWTTLRGWDKDAQRGVLQAFNIAMHSVTFTVYLGTGKAAAVALPVYAGVLAAVVLPAVAGVLLFRRLTTLQFRRLILVLLTASGVALIAGSVSVWLR